MSEREPPAGTDGPASPPTLAGLGLLADRLQAAPGDADAARLDALLAGWRAWLTDGGDDSALLRRVLDAVAGWGAGALSRTQFEAAINRLWAAQLDALDRERGAREGGGRGAEQEA